MSTYFVNAAEWTGHRAGCTLTHLLCSVSSHVFPIPPMTHRSLLPESTSEYSTHWPRFITVRVKSWLMLPTSALFSTCIKSIPQSTCFTVNDSDIVGCLLRLFNKGTLPALLASPSSPLWLVLQRVLQVCESHLFFLTMGNPERCHYWASAVCAWEAGYRVQVPVPAFVIWVTPSSYLTTPWL